MTDFCQLHSGMYNRLVNVYSLDLQIEDHGCAFNKMSLFLFDLFICKCRR